MTIYSRIIIGSRVALFVTAALKDCKNYGKNTYMDNRHPVGEKVIRNFNTLLV